MHKKKILIFIDWYLPGYKAGGPIRSIANLVEYLKDEFDFFIVTRDTDFLEKKSYPNIKSNSWNKVYDANIYYFSKPNLNFKNIISIINSQKFDAVYLNSFFSFHFTIVPLISSKISYKKNKIILAPRGMLGEGALSLKPVKKRIYILISKLFGIYNGILWHATSLEEKLEIENYFGRKSKILLASNLSQKVPDKISKREKSTDNTSFVFLSRISRKKNLEFALEIFSKIKLKNKIVFHVYGPVEDEKYWNRCLEKSKKLPQNVLFSYKGIVDSASINKVFSQYHFSFFPTLNENFGHVIFESLAAGCPVIISDQTPWKNLEGKKVGWDISLDDRSGFEKIVHKCSLMEQMEYESISYSSYQYAKKISENIDAIEMTEKLFL